MSKHEPRMPSEGQGQSTADADTSDKHFVHPKRDRMAMLAIAAALNGTAITPLSSPDEAFRHVRLTDEGVAVVGVKQGYKGVLLSELEDYFYYSTVESSQFDRQETLAFIDKLNETQVLQLLHAMGCCPFGCMHDRGDQWERFVAALVDEDYDNWPLPIPC